MLPNAAATEPDPIPVNSTLSVGFISRCTDEMGDGIRGKASSKVAQFDNDGKRVELAAILTESPPYPTIGVYDDDEEFMQIVSKSNKNRENKHIKSSEEEHDPKQTPRADRSTIVMKRTNDFRHKKAKYLNENYKLIEFRS